MLHNVEVVGDIEGIKQAGSAVYFTIKDEDASINCVCYAPERMKCIATGSQVVVRGSVSYWHKAGKVSFIVNRCEAFGFGQLFLKFKELQEKLRAEGLFDAGAKKALPAEVRRIGVVTSKTGAVIHDIIKVAHKRNPATDIVLFPVAVQGMGADAEIAAGVNFFGGGVGGNAPHEKIDVIIVARGGGSKEDLAAFDSERVARAVFASTIPVVSAVGHETDWTLIDFVADLRAATPSAAAELAVTEAVSRRDAALRVWRHIAFVTKSKYDGALNRALAGWAGSRTAVLARITEFENRVSRAADRISSHNPMEVLKRGFAHTSRPFAELREGDEFTVTFYDGKVIAGVKQKIKGREK